VTDPGTLFVAILALLVAMAAVAVHVPRPRPLDASRAFKAALQGRVPAEWAPWHPLAAEPEAKVGAPATWQPRGQPQPGEFAHVRALAGLPGEARWAALFAGGAPLPFPPDADPAAWLGGSWNALPSGTEEGRVWVVVRSSAEPPGIGAMDFVVADGESLDEAVERLLAFLEAAATDPASRFVLVGRGLAVHVLLRAYAGAPGLRDRVAAVVSAGAPIAGTGDDGPTGRAAVEDWLGAWFRHERLDTEAADPVPFLAWQWFEPGAPEPGLIGVPLRDARWPDPGTPDRVHTAIEVHDLGPLDRRCPEAAVWEALRFTVAALGARAS
jgi:hypothetical protein